MNFLKTFAFIFLICLLAACQTKEPMRKQKIDIQGHRGARGLLPENTIPAFLKALELGVTTLELDLAVTKDGQLLVSHEPYMNPEIALDSMGNEIPQSEGLAHNIYQMTYVQIKKYDVGSKENYRFPNQKKMKATKPLLIDLVKAVEDYRTDNAIGPVWWNIEIKSDPRGDNLYHPTPADFSRLVYSFVNENMDKRQVNIQSFDFRVLQYFHENFPDIVLAALVENEIGIDKNLEELGFYPEIYSCYFKLLDADKVKYLQEKNIKVIPWTVNNAKDIKMTVEWQVDGIISDYPDRVLKIISE